MLKYDPGSKQVQLVSDRGYRAGQEILVWCGPQVGPAAVPALACPLGEPPAGLHLGRALQPNRRLFVNYGLVDEGNPWDRMALTVRACWCAAEAWPSLPRLTPLAAAGDAAGQRPPVPAEARPAAAAQHGQPADVPAGAGPGRPLA